MRLDLEKKRLFVAAAGNNSLEFVDLTGGKVTNGLTGFNDTQDTLFLAAPSTNCMRPASIAI
jgi:hypothetical protein